jgi:hypothetical protein
VIQIKTYQQVIYDDQPGRWRWWTRRSRKHAAATLPTWGACGSSSDTIGWLRLIPRLKHALGALGGSVGQSLPQERAHPKGAVMDWTAGYGPWTAEHDGMWLDLINSLT